eukprot:349679-Chlamydomonas_euryale.AAC.19
MHCMQVCRKPRSVPVPVPTALLPRTHTCLPRSFQSNVKAFYWAIASGLKVPMAGLLVGCAGAAVASPKNAPTIAAAGASLAALAAGGMLLWFKSKHRALQRASMADDLGW